MPPDPPDPHMHMQIAEATFLSLMASMLSEVCHNVCMYCIEPRLQPLTGECFDHNSANSGNDSKLDVAANGVWGSRFERTFFDVRIFNPFANRCATLSAAYHKHEEEKKRSYQQCVLDVIPHFCHSYFHQLVEWESVVHLCTSNYHY